MNINNDANAKRKLNNNRKKPQHSDVEVINFNIEIPSFDPIISRDNIVENGHNNSIYDFVDECFKVSPTNSAIINSIKNYIIADGLFDKNGYDIYQHIEKEDIELIALDFKKYGGYALQILWGLDEQIQKIKYLNIKKVLLQIDNFGDVNGYWYSFNLHKQSQFPKQFYPKFDGTFKQTEDEKFYREILVVQRTSGEDFYSNCDYLPALSCAKLEGELIKSAITFTNNNFTAGVIINCNGLLPPTDELREKYKQKILNELTGANNTARTIVSFNVNAEQTMTAEVLPTNEMSDTFSLFSQEAQSKLILGHATLPQLHSGFTQSHNLGTSKEELKQAVESLYIRTVNPMRNTICNGLHKVFKHINPNIDLKFKDFAWLNEDKNEENNNG
ncbi:hypothetical protein [Paenimyroides baculatum]|uniref:Phage portal protein n=1 Tax=Paenimyroides baculatum TaxID=2608000 RepID=A0A5M6CGF5_9FLAO|nr:hypothetical protein [Paenimyroides baculatum]KAA5534298.1 hypothetical protein F0460_09325 [Paenimyroides baculatum]